MTFTAGEVRIYYSSRVPSLKLTDQREYRGPCPIHHGKDPNFAVGADSGLATCHSQCGRSWDIISLEQELTGSDFVRAKEHVFEIVGRPKVSWEERDIQAIYDYTDETGKLLYQVLRKVGKKFAQRRPDPNGGWVYGLGDVARMPFRLPRIVSSDFCAVVEGEKDAIALEGLGIAATCNSGGAGNFKPELAPWFTGKAIAIIPDNDDPGRVHAVKVASLLAPIAKTVRIVEIPRLPAKGDVSDFIESGGTLADLRALYAKAQPWTPDWEFSSDIPNENDRYVLGPAQDIEAAGGIDGFWELTKLAGLETPWPKLSRALGGGLRAGEVYILGANQGSGKTSIALQFAMAAMRRSQGVLYFSMEMSHRAIFQRMVSIEAHVDLNEYRDAQITLRRRDASPLQRIEAQEAIAGMIPHLARFTKELAVLPLLVSTKSSVSPKYIVSEAARLNKRMRLHLAIVDHMQLMGSDTKSRSEYERFTEISRSMKTVAVDLDIPVLLISQTSRRQSKDSREELEVSDLRGTGALEEDAAAALLLYEDHKDANLAMADGDGSRYTKGPVKAILKVGKNRYGPQGRCFVFQHIKSCTRFDMEELR